jgi:hypothetical protein
MSTTVEPLSLERQAALWRRTAEVQDDRLYAFMVGESARRAARWRRSPRGVWWRLTGPARRRWYGFAARVWVVFPGVADRLNERDSERLREREARRDRTVVCFGDLASARHGLSVPRFYPAERLREEHFRSSDPLSKFYVGVLESDFARARREIDGEFA